MQVVDDLLLECLEDVYHSLEKALRKLENVRSIHVAEMERLAEELRSERRIFEELSGPARLIVEHLLECQHKNALVSIEAEQISQPFATVGKISVLPFGIIKLTLSNLELAWRDGNYTYYLYPDKIELRARDEKSGIKLFFTLPFSRQLIEGFADLPAAKNLAYIHPQLVKWFKTN
ncbi:hypothetical protein [Paradesulfitobacterium ferrireducens]|uniref:hypothetical protein n=1 Tax=Paradesulfitobacterium ferrireducens TaxID=2816476 RepID=UPI001A8F90BD